MRTILQHIHIEYGFNDYGIGDEFGLPLMSVQVYFLGKIVKIEILENI